ncbi:LysR family transcriptional regulator [uncultured Mailhella sp.]|uniref:LysR family transcriptional regulator n=1 Tax=uncultured Mailhella sp. TaxID=1981031 RepID=UPI002628FC8A|nr:LysR family transcriptional regulator [uncultured Mailhella sp.]
MDARVLRYFLAVAREGSVTAAAHFLHVTQPTLSRQIRELEDELSVQLFVRHSHSVSLTTDGMRLRRRAEEIVEMFEKTEAEFAVKKERIGGDIYIGAGETRVMRHVAEVLRELRQEYPDIHIHLYSGNLEDVTERLDKGLLDFGVLIQPADLSRYDYVNLPEKDVWGVITRKDNPLAARPAITRQDLIGEPLILSRQAIRRTSARNEFIEWFKDDFAKLNVAATLNLVYNATHLVESGIGHVLTLDGLVDTSEHSNLCFRLLEPRLEAGLNIVWKKYQVFSPAAEIFLKKIQAAFGEVR